MWYCRLDYICWKFSFSIPKINYIYIMFFFFYIYTVISHCNNISQYSFYCILAKYWLCEHETSLNNTENTSPNFWTVVVILSIDFNMNYNILDMLPHFYSQISLHNTAVSAFMFCIIQTNDNLYSDVSLTRLPWLLITLTLQFTTWTNCMAFKSADF